MKSSEIAFFLSKELRGEDIEINGFSSLSNLVEGTVVFAKKYTREYAEVLNKAKGVLAIVCEDFRDNIAVAHIVSNNPRLDYMRVIGAFFAETDIPTGIHASANIEKGAVIGNNVSIGANCHIGSKVTIGDNTIILPNCSIIGNVSIGHDCYIKPGVVIGGPGFGFEFDDDGVPVHFPHTGGVCIGDNVMIGSNSTIDRATIDTTVIEDNVKIDNLVQIAHNCHIGKNSLIIGGAMIGGGVTIGESCWISPNVTILQQVRIGSHCKVGIGSVVLRNIKDGATVFGNPAKKIQLPKIG